MTAIVKSFDGRNFAPYAIIRQTAKTATVFACDVDGGRLGEDVTRRINDTHGAPAIDLDRYTTVYLTEAYAA